MSENKSLYSRLCALIIEFTICGVVGWVYETTLTSYLWGRFAERGFLHIPVLPIYGFFSLLLIVVFKKHNGIFTVFFGGMAIITALELLSSYVIEAVLKTSLWSYASWSFNFQGRISLYSSLAFGALSVLLVKAIHPLVQKLNRKLPTVSLIAVGTTLLLIILVDFAITLCQTL